MTRVKRITALVCAVLMLAVLSSCGEKADCVMKVGDYEISKDEYLYFWNNHRKANPDKTSDEIKKLCENSLREAYSLWELAQENGYEFSKDDEKKVDEYFNQALDMYGGEDSFKDALKQANMTEDVFREEMKRETLEISLRNYMMEEVASRIKSDDETVKKDIEKNFIRILQIYIANDDGENASDNKALAQDIRAQLTSGASFEELMAQYNEDEAEKADGYAFTDGQMKVEIEENAKKLSIGDISEVFESDGGFHIIKRVDLPNEYVEANFETLRYYYKCRVFNEMRKETADGMKIKYTSLYDELTLK